MLACIIIKLCGIYQSLCMQQVIADRFSFFWTSSHTEFWGKRPFLMQKYDCIKLLHFSHHIFFKTHISHPPHFYHPQKLLSHGSITCSLQCILATVIIFSKIWFMTTLPFYFKGCTIFNLLGVLQLWPKYFLFAVYQCVLQFSISKLYWVLGSAFFMTGTFGKSLVICFCCSFKWRKFLTLLPIRASCTPTIYHCWYIPGCYKWNYTLSFIISTKNNLSHQLGFTV